MSELLKAARALVAECDFDKPPSLGALERLARAVAADNGPPVAAASVVAPSDDEIGAVFDRLNTEWRDDGGNMFYPWAKCREPDEKGRESAIAHIVRGVAMHFALIRGAPARAAPEHRQCWYCEECMQTMPAGPMHDCPKDNERRAANRRATLSLEVA